MAFSPAGFYTVADALRLKESVDGPYLRTVISRAYYGALIAARDNKGISTKQQNGHQKVIDAYKYGNSQDEMLADHLSKLRSLREKADYQPRTNLTSGDALLALANCKKVLFWLGQLPPRPPAPPSAGTSEVVI